MKKNPKISEGLAGINTATERVADLQNSRLTRIVRGARRRIASAALPLVIISGNAGCAELLDLDAFSSAGSQGGEGGMGGEGGTTGIGGFGGTGGGECVPTEEVCDGIDNNCNDEIDENPSMPQCAEPDEGVCQGASAERTCEGVSGPSQCSYEIDPNYEPGDEQTCNDGLDNNCNGTVDENCLTLNETTCHKFAYFSTNQSTIFEAGSSADDDICATDAVTVLSSSGNRIVVWVRDTNSITLTTDAPVTCYKACSGQLTPPTHSDILDDIAANTPFNDVANSQVNGLDTVWTNPDSCPRYLFVCDRTS